MQKSVSCSLSETQKGMLFHQEYEKTADTYIIQKKYSLIGYVDKARLERAWKLTTAMHPILKASVVYGVANEPLLVVKPGESYRFISYDTEESADLIEEFLSRLEENERKAVRPTDHGPLCSLAIVITPDDRQLLMITLNHIIVDGMSINTILHDIENNYAKVDVEEGLSHWTDLAYFVYRDRVTIKKLDEALAYWKKLLVGVAYESGSALLRKANLYAKADVKVIEYEMSKAVSRRIRNFCAKNRVTISTFMHSVWALVLAIYQNTKVTAHATVVMQRSSDIVGIENAVGPFLNTVPIIISIDSLGSVGDIFASANAAIYDAIDNSSAAIADIVSLGEKYDVLDAIQTLVVIENFINSNERINQEDRVIRDQISSYDVTNYGISLMVVPHDNLYLKYTYRNELIDAKKMAAIAETANEVIEYYLNGMNCRIADISFNLKGELREHGEYHHVSMNVDYDTVYDLFLGQAVEYPTKTAVYYQSQPTSYDELLTLTTRVQDVLKVRGIGRGDRVGIMMKKSPQLIAAMLGCLGSGVTYVPIDYRTPEERVQFLVNDSDIDCLIVDPKMDVNSFDVVSIVMYRELGRDGSIRIREHISCYDDVAYINYTSGSSGAPKGVAISGRSLIGYLKWINEIAKAKDIKVIPFTSNPAFDASLKQSLAPIIEGRYVYIVSADAESDYARLVSEMAGQCNIGFNAVPSSIDEFVEEAKDSLGERVVALLSGGERLDVGAMKRWKEGLSGVSVINLYGPTECTANCLWNDLTYADEVTLGREVLGASASIRGRLGIVNPSYAVGELIIAGECVGLGYIGRDALTRDKFENVIMPDGTLQRAYRTGDLAFFDKNGVYHFVGRADSQVKIRGYRIELEEIEWRMREVAGVKDSAVILIDDRTIIAFIEALQAGNASEQNVIEYLQRYLPSYMLPNQVILISEMPRDGNGKVSRRELEKKYRNEIRQIGAECKTHDLLEGVIIEIWKEVLQTENLSVNSNFFQLGGHSLLAMRLVRTTNKLLGIRDSVKIVYAKQTVAKYAEHIDAEYPEIRAKLDRIAGDKVRFD